MGDIFLNDVNISEHILSQGWATVIQPRYGQQNRRRGLPKNFEVLAQEARDKMLGVYKGYVANDGDEKNDDDTRSRRIADSKTAHEMEVVVSHIETATVFYVNLADSEAMQKMASEMEALKKDATIPKKSGLESKYVMQQSMMVIM